MLPTRYRRLWRRRLRRRPLVPFLMAATLAVDALGYPMTTDNVYLPMLALGFFSGQWLLLGFWISHRRFGILWRFVLCVGPAVALFYTATRGWDPTERLYASWPAAFSVIAGAGLAGATHAVVHRHGNRLRRQLRWRFSIGLLVGLLTFLPLGIIAVRAGQPAFAQLVLVREFWIGMLIECMIAAFIFLASLRLRSKKSFALGVAVWALAVTALLTVSVDDNALVAPETFYGGQLLVVGGWLLALKVRGASIGHDRGRVGSAGGQASDSRVETAPVSIDITA